MIAETQEGVVPIVVEVVVRIVEVVGVVIIVAVKVGALVKKKLGTSSGGRSCSCSCISCISGSCNRTSSRSKKWKQK
jgi:hypothetical protein